MANPYAIQIHCDGAMDYDSTQTGGNGFIIEFPDEFSLEPIERATRNDGQGIHRLEIISIIEAMEELSAWAKQNPAHARKAAGVEIYTDRIRVTDGELVNPWRIAGWRRMKWRNHEGVEVKDRDLLDRLDKLRTKLCQSIGGRVTVTYEREKKNRKADKLSKAGKKSEETSRRIYRKKNRQVTKRLYNGPEIDYTRLRAGSELIIRVYAWERIGTQYEVCFEVCEGEWLGQMARTTVEESEKSRLHRTHRYRVELTRVLKYRVMVNILVEDLTA